MKPLIILAACSPMIASLAIAGCLFGKDFWWVFVLVALLCAPKIHHSECDKEADLKEIKDRLSNLERGK